MYRELAPVEPDVEVPVEFVYRTTNRGGNGWPSFAVFQLFAIPPLVVAVFCLFEYPTLGFLGMFVAAAFLVGWWKRRGRGTSFRLRVEQGELKVWRGTTTSEEARFALSDLLDVMLDTKTVSMIQESGSAIPAMRFIEAKAGPEIDKARIVLVGEHHGPTSVGKTYRLGEDYLPHMDATESLGKIRVFLRKNGWIPQNEREASDADD